MSAALLEANQLGWNIPHGRSLFHGLNFAVQRGQLLFIGGPNGSGKSTLLRLLLREIMPSRGLVRCTVPADKIAYVPQLQNMEFHLPVTLGEVIEISREHEVSPQAVEAVGLLSPDKLSLTWNTASGGERQRTLLTCALLDSPELVVLDEPFNHLDHDSQEAMLQAILKFLADGSRPRAAVLVSHLAIDGLTELGDKVVTIDLSRSRKKEID